MIAVNVILIAKGRRGSIIDRVFRNQRTQAGGPKMGLDFSIHSGEAKAIPKVGDLQP